MKKKSPNIKRNITELIQPLGVSKQQGMVTFSVSVPNAQECKLHLYQGNCNIPKRTILLTKENSFGNVFNYHMEEEELIYDSYRFEALGKEFIDPYATKIIGREEFGKCLSKEERMQVRGSFDFSEFDWGVEDRPRIPYDKMILYKLHVRGFTKDKSSGVKHKGTYLGIIEKIPYLKELGVNALLVMPTVEFNEVVIDTFASNMPAYTKDYRYLDKNQSIGQVDESSSKLNFWGYTGDCQYFAPKASYANDPSQAKTEFKKMVKELHKNGIEVIMEMHFENGNRPLFIVDCLRFWAMEYHVDGFRLTKDMGIGRLVATDPYLSDRKILNQFWNTDEIYEREAMPLLKTLSEYNEGFLNDTRKFLKGDENQIGKFVENFCCNPKNKGRINYITDHNGFTLMDLYSYDRKHNEANGENNRDGTDYNNSWNCGVEGKTRKKKINELRTQMRKNALVALILSQGTPMLLAGDEFGNSQAGNNNAYCQDNVTAWVDWKPLKLGDSIFDFTKELISLRKEHKVLRNDTQLRIMDYISCGYPDVSFHGTKAWCPEYVSYCRTLGILLCGNYALQTNGGVDNTFYFAFNMHWESHKFDIPDLPRNLEWKLLLSTDGDNDVGRVKKEAIKRQTIVLNPRSAVILMSQTRNTSSSEENRSNQKEN